MSSGRAYNYAVAGMNADIYRVLCAFVDVLCACEGSVLIFASKNWYRLSKCMIMAQGVGENANEEKGT
jgi:hypothetical protein